MVKCKPYVKCRPYIQQRAEPQDFWTVPALCQAYKWPTNLKPKFDSPIGILEMGGGWLNRDVLAYSKLLGFPAPNITDVSVDGTKNTYQNPNSDADVEVMLDIQVSAASYSVATGGYRPKIRTYFSQDISSAIKAAAADGCCVFSISWGADEAEWGLQAGLDLDAAATLAVQSGMTIVVAAGDNDSSDGGPTPANVDLPGSSPHVICVGGTTKTRTEEYVWGSANPDGSGTGGGYSRFFGEQAWQVGAPPPPQPLLGRMVPDVTILADPDWGYEMFVYGSEQIVGGTSAGAPMYAGLIAAICNATDGKGKGLITPQLWASRLTAFVDITIGENGLYKAGPGPDATSGIGVPVGEAIAKLFGL